MSEPLAENVPYVGGPMDGKSCRLLYCESESVCMADATHYYRLVRVKGSGVATLMYAGWISTKEAATMSDDAELSVASAGSVAGDIVCRLTAWRDEPGFPTPGEMMDEAANEIVSLRLTEAEREAIEFAVKALGEIFEERVELAGSEHPACGFGIKCGKHSDTLRGLLERTK